MTHFNRMKQERIGREKEKTDKLSRIRCRSEDQVREPACALEFLILLEIQLIVDAPRFGGERIQDAAVEHLAGEIASVEVLFEDGFIEPLESSSRTSSEEA